MNINDLLYRAFRDYRKNTESDRECERRRRAAVRAGANDALEIDETECEIEDDWIEAIEESLIHIAKAIEEERQFIRSNGEVVPIEKVKSVSRESAEHLSRHGELITRRQNEDIIPDKLYTVERLSDYSVYENRFLYMLLCYMRDFISYRYGKIAEYSNTYRGRLHMEKTVDTGSRQTVVSLHAEDVRKNDPLTIEKSGVKEKLARIDGALKTVHLLLGTPLMQEVAKAALLKPPITETNVLKMDKNFKGAVRLYYFLTSYQKDGFIVRKTVHRFSPLPDEAADEFAETPELIAFLMYAHGMRIGEDLRRSYDEEEERRKREEIRKLEERIKSLKKRIVASGKSAEEYMLLLEERYRSLEKENASQTEMRARAERLLAEAEQKSAALERTLQESRRAAEEAAKAHGEEIARLEEEHRGEMAAARQRHEEERASLLAKHAEQTAALKSAQEEREKAFAAEIALLQEAGKAAEEKYAAVERQRQQAEDEKARLEERCTLTDARINALKSEYGAFAPGEDFTSREGFDEIERQYEVFRAFFKNEWRKAKKRIRKEALAKALAPERKEDGGQDAGDKGGDAGES